MLWSTLWKKMHSFQSFNTTIYFSFNSVFHRQRLPCIRQRRDHDTVQCRKVGHQQERNQIIRYDHLCYSSSLGCWILLRLVCAYFEIPELNENKQKFTESESHGACFMGSLATGNWQPPLAGASWTPILACVGAPYGACSEDTLCGNRIEVPLYSMGSQCRKTEQGGSARLRFQQQEVNFFKSILSLGTTLGLVFFRLTRHVASILYFMGKEASNEKFKPIIL